MGVRLDGRERLTVFIRDLDDIDWSWCSIAMPLSYAPLLLTRGARLGRCDLREHVKVLLTMSWS